MIEELRDIRVSFNHLRRAATPQTARSRQQLNHDIPERGVSQILDDVYHPRLQQLAFSIAITKSLRLLVTRGANDVSVARHVQQVVVRMAMAERAIVGRNLDCKRAHEFILDDEMMARLLLDGHDVPARVSLLVHSYSFVGVDTGLNSITIKRISRSPTLVSPWSGWPP